jgi:hypothetical protein
MTKDENILNANSPFLFLAHSRQVTEAADGLRPGNYHWYLCTRNSSAFAPSHVRLTCLPERDAQWTMGLTTVPCLVPSKLWRSL